MTFSHGNLRIDPKDTVEDDFESTTVSLLCRPLAEIPLWSQDQEMLCHS